MPHLAQAGYHLGPSEDLLDVLGNALIGRMAGVTSSAALNRERLPLSMSKSQRRIACRCQGIVCGRWYTVRLASARPGMLCTTRKVLGTLLLKKRLFAINLP
jgi:hypothetical protein